MYQISTTVKRLDELFFWYYIRTMAKPKRTGRPKLPRAEVKGEIVKFVATKEQKRAMEAAAERDRRTLSDWLRSVALTAAEASDTK